MKKRILCTVLACLLAASLAACGGAPDSASSSDSPAPASSAPPASSAGDGGQNLAAEFEMPLLAADNYAEVMKGFAALTGGQVLGDENLCYSPASLYFALSLVATGAAGDTQAQLFEVLGVPEGEQALLEATVREALDDLVFEQRGDASNSAREDEPGAKGRESDIALANSVWINEGYGFSPDFAAGAEQYWDASLFTAPFGTEATNEAMGSWVSEKTKGLIDTPVETSAEDIMVLFNALYFADGWQETFSEADNERDSFTLAGGETMEAEYMYRSMEHHGYHQGDGFLMTSLYLAHGTMRFVLPDEGVPLSSLTTAEALGRLLSMDHTGMATSTVNIHLPKFDFGSSLDLIEPLRALGVESAFVSGAESDFSALSASGQDDAYISMVKQFTQVAVDEEGVQAAASTVIMVLPDAAMLEPPPEIEFDLNRPFLFFIEYQGVPLFIGVVAQPTAA